MLDTTNIYKTKFLNNLDLQYLCCSKIVYFYFGKLIHQYLNALGNQLKSVNHIFLIYIFVYLNI